MFYQKITGIGYFGIILVSSRLTARVRSPAFYKKSAEIHIAKSVLVMDASQVGWVGGGTVSGQVHRSSVENVKRQQDRADDHHAFHETRSQGICL